jgi:hypothetical protein
MRSATNRPVPLALSPKWYTATIAMEKLRRRSKGTMSVSESIVAVAERMKLPDTFVQWARASYGLRAKLCSCPKPTQAATIYYSDCLLHGEQNNPQAWPPGLRHKNGARYKTAKGRP